MKDNSKQYKQAASFLAFVIVFVIVWAFFLSRVHPDVIVAFLGIENTYGIMFGIALLGGVSSLSGALIYTALATFVFGGSNVFFIGLVCGFGVFLSDMFFYFLASQSHPIVPVSIKQRIHNMYQKLEKKRSWSLSLFIFLYAGCSFLPTDFLIIPLALSHYPLRKAAPFFFIGALFHFMAVAFLFSQGLSLF